MGISPKDFEKMKERVNGAARRPARRSPQTLSEPISPAFNSAGQVVIGIDPSLRGTGYGIIRFEKPKPVALAHGTISCPAGWDRSRCLVRIAETLRDAIRQFQPAVCAVEGLFYAQNFQTALIMGEARGACLVAAGEAGLQIFEIAPRKVKQAIVGYGAAQKLAVAKMVQRMLALAEMPDPDAADALALALAFAQETSRFNLAAPKRV